MADSKVPKNHKKIDAFQITYGTLQPIIFTEHKALSEEMMRDFKGFNLKEM